MPIPVAIGAALAAGGINLGTTIWQNRANRRAQERAFEQNKQFWRERFDKEAQYSSPVQQMARYKEAGLNPALMYKAGAGSSGNVSGPSAQGKIAEKYDMAQLAMMSAQTAKIVQDAQKSKAEAEYVEAKTTGQGTSNEKLVVELAKSKIELENWDKKTKAGVEKLVQEAAKAMAEAESASMKKAIFEGVQYKAFKQYGINLDSSGVSVLLQGLMVGTEKAWEKSKDLMNYLGEISKEYGAMPGINPMQHIDKLWK